MSNQRNQQTKSARAIALVMIGLCLLALILAALGIAPQLAPIAIGLLITNVALLFLVR